MTYSAKLKAVIQAKKSRACIGIDPHTSHLSGFLLERLKNDGSEKWLTDLSRSIIDGAREYFPVVKFQSAFFECHGSHGFRALELGMRYARDCGLVTILDAKRGDMSSTMQAYGHAAYDVIGADALTVTLYLGKDVLTALLPWLQKKHGCYVVWVTSNKSADDLQMLRVYHAGTQANVAGELLKLVDDFATENNIVESVGQVLGATQSHKLNLWPSLNSQKRMLLLPGLGAQGGAIDEGINQIFEHHPLALASSSRAITGLGGQQTGFDWTKIKTWIDYSAAVRKMSRIFADECSKLIKA